MAASWRSSLESSAAADTAWSARAPPTEPSNSIKKHFDAIGAWGRQSRSFPTHASGSGILRHATFRASCTAAVSGGDSAASRRSVRTANSFQADDSSERLDRGQPHLFVRILRRPEDGRHGRGDRQLPHKVEQDREVSRGGAIEMRHDGFVCRAAAQLHQACLRRRSQRGVARHDRFQKHRHGRSISQLPQNVNGGRTDFWGPLAASLRIAGDAAASWRSPIARISST